MGILLALGPFIVFGVVQAFAGPVSGLIAGALTSAAVLARDRARSKAPPKILDAGTALLFGGLTLITLLFRPAWSIIGVRLCLDAGLLAIVLGSIAVRRPFTLQYARERVPEAFWGNPVFIRTNYIITGVWTLAFAVMVTADSTLLFVPGVPLAAGVSATVLAFAAAVWFTGWYPGRARARAVAAREGR